MIDPVMIAIACGLVAVLYGFITSRQVLSASPGNEKMQEIAAAIQEGAKAVSYTHLTLPTSDLV